jgi:hypothetical protein
MRKVCLALTLELGLLTSELVLLTRLILEFELEFAESAMKSVEESVVESIALNALGSIAWKIDVESGAEFAVDSAAEKHSPGTTPDVRLVPCQLVKPPKPASVAALGLRPSSFGQRQGSKRALS